MIIEITWNMELGRKHDEHAAIIMEMSPKMTVNTKKKITALCWAENRRWENVECPTQKPMQEQFSGWSVAFFNSESYRVLRRTVHFVHALSRPLIGIVRRRRPDLSQRGYLGSDAIPKNAVLVDRVEFPYFNHLKVWQINKLKHTCHEVKKTPIELIAMPNRVKKMLASRKPRR